jgi:hypothetical protein
MAEPLTLVENVDEPMLAGLFTEHAAAYSFDALFDVAVQLTHMCHTAKERDDREALADYRARRNLVRAELERRCER